MLDILKFLLLGLIQGITEPLPVSSSGHLVLAQELLGYNFTDINLEVILNFASLIAILFFYRNDIVNLVKNNYAFVVKQDKSKKKDFIYVLFLVLATIPAVVVGFLFKDILEQYLKNSVTVGISLLVTAAALLLINKLGSRNTRKEINTMDAVVMGTAQAIALIPGISRSGSTLVGGLSRKVESNSALKFSFLMYIPISLGSMILVIKDINFSEINILAYSLSFLVAMVATYISLKLLYKIVKHSNLHYFAYYCVLAGVFGIILGIL